MKRVAATFDERVAYYAMEREARAKSDAWDKKRPPKVGARDRPLPPAPSAPFTPPA